MKDKTRTALLAFLLSVGAFAFALVYFIMAYGPGVSPDSTVYIGTARSLLAGTGFYFSGDPMTHFPPAYPLLLAASSLFSSDLLQAARLLHAALYAANAVLFVLCVYICTKRNHAATACAVLIYFSSKAILVAHSMVWSEPPFVTFSLAAILCISLYVRAPAPRQTLFLLIASGSVGLAILTRYVGVTLLPAVLFGVLFSHFPAKRKLRDLAIIISIASVPIGIWLARNCIVAHTSTNRGFAVHPAGLAHVKRLIKTLVAFILPGPVPGWVAGIFFAGLGVLVLLALWVLYRRKYIEENKDSVCVMLPSLGICFSFVYIAFIFVSISLLDATTPFDDRILLPVFVFLALGMISLACSVSQSLRNPTIWRAVVLCILLSVGINSIRAAKAAVCTHIEGRGYNSRKWNASPTVLLVKAIRGPRMKIYSNGPEVINFMTGSDACTIPRLWLPLSMQQNQDYEKQLQVMCRECLDGRAIIVWLNDESFSKCSWLPSAEKMNLSHRGIPVLKQTADGAIYGREGLKLTAADRAGNASK